MEEETAEKKEILRELVRTETESLEKLRELVKKAKDLMWIEEKTGYPTIIKRGLELSDQIKLYLMGIHFASELGILDKKSADLEQIKAALHVEGRALSRPLGDLVKSHIISESSSGYEMNAYYVSDIIDEIHGKKSKPILGLGIIKRKIQKMGETAEKKEIQRELIENSQNKLEKAASLKEGTIHHIFDFEKSDVKLIYPVAEENVSEATKHYRATILYLTALDQCYGMNEVSSNELRKRLSDLGLTSIANLSTSLKNYSSHIVHKKGPKGSNDTSYKLTIPGKIQGLEIIKKIGENNEKGKSN